MHCCSLNLSAASSVPCFVYLDRAAVKHGARAGLRGAHSTRRIMEAEVRITSGGIPSHLQSYSSGHGSSSRQQLAAVMSHIDRHVACDGTMAITSQLARREANLSSATFAHLVASFSITRFVWRSHLTQRCVLTSDYEFWVRFLSCSSQPVAWAKLLMAIPSSAWAAVTLHREV